MGTRILYVHGIEAIGGAERDLVAMLGKLDRHAWRLEVACPGRGPFRELVAALGVPVYPIELAPWRKLSSVVSRYSSVRCLRAIIEDCQPALIHVNDLWWVPHTVRAVAGVTSRRIPVIAHVRQEIQPIKVRQYSLDHVDFVLAVSRQVQQKLETGGVARDRVRTIYSGVDLALFGKPVSGDVVRARHAVPSDALLLGTVANLLPLKGYEVMLRALPSVLAAVPHVHYLIVGTGDAAYTQRLKSLSIELGIADRIHFAGFQYPVHPYLAAMDVYGHPSLREAFGLAVAEAMAMGKAVVATRTGGIPELVAHDDTGVLVDPADSEALSAAVVLLLQDRATRDRMGACGRTRVQERFSLDASVAETEQVYGAVLALRKDR